VFAVQPGLNIVICPMSQLVGRLSFRVQQLNVRVETKTLDNVFLVAVVCVQYQVLREKAFEAFYALTNPTQQITAHVYDVMRSELPTLELDAVFEAKEELAIAVKNALAETMTSYGYQIIQVKIRQVKAAEADAEAKYLSGEFISCVTRVFLRLTWQCIYLYSLCYVRYL
jgi:regulator of protease activity HflC (stomatin/prohibitin superfamily)